MNGVVCFILMILCNYSEQDCAELHSPYENVVAAGQNPSP